MKPAQYLVVVASGVFDGRLMLLVVAVAEAAVDAVAAHRADTQADHSSQRQLACKATHFQRARPEKYGDKSMGLSIQIKDKNSTFKLHLCYFLSN